MILENEVRLSNSKLWEYQGRFYKNMGVNAWQKNIVPHYITSNPFLANTYASLIVKYLGDYAKETPKNLRSKLIFLELGAGSGKFAFQMLRQLNDLLKGSDLADLDYLYVMSDYARSNIEFWKKHDAMQPYIEAGALDFCEFDATCSESLNLEISGELLTVDSCQNPIICISNYFFDSLPQDAFKIEKGKLYESLCVLTASEEDMEQEDILQKVEVKFNHFAVESTAYYDEQYLNDLLSFYRESLEDTHFTIPNEALDCLKRIEAISNGEVVVLSADKGHSTLRSLMFQSEFDVTKHGSISMAVNYDAIGRMFDDKGGIMLFADQTPSHINMVAFLSAPALAISPDMEMIYLNKMTHFSPDDFYTIRESLISNSIEMSLVQIEAVLRLTCFDPNTFVALVPVILKRLEVKYNEGSSYWRTILKSIWKNHYPLEIKDDLAFMIGTVAYAMRDYHFAIEFFILSMNTYGEGYDTCYNLALCYFYTNSLDEALVFVEKARAIQSEHKPVLILKQKIQDRQSGAGGL